MGVDQGPHVPGKSRWVYYGYWFELSYDYNWNIAAIVEGIFPLKAVSNGPYLAYVGEDIEFNGDATGGIPPYSDWYWDFGTGDTSTQQSLTYSYDTAGIYQVKFKVEDLSNDWAKIRLSDGKIGWVKQNVYEII